MQPVTDSPTTPELVIFGDPHPLLGTLKYTINLNLFTTYMICFEKPIKAENVKFQKLAHLNKQISIF